MPRRLAFVAPYQAAVLEYEEAPLQAQQVRVQTEIASGKHGTTMGMFDGRTFQGQEFDQTMRVFVEAESGAAPRVPTPDHPWNTGTTGVGTVVEVGPEVTRWRVGDRVFGLMDVRETNICRADRLWALGAIDPLLALCIEPAYVAFHAVRESQVRFGDSVVVVGLGVLGLLAVRMAVLSGAETVMAVDMLPQRRELALQLGADAALDPR
ncbi:MAG TPA: zinc-binding dehydrogenase, partial [Caldilineaceae bacterium]|nr:zinc-binding dehydrogenase [Caldilineaceae bacterium]